MDIPYLNSNDVLISLYRLEFYKKKMNWKFSQDSRQPSADVADADTKDDEEPHPNGKQSLNTTYIVVEDSTEDGSRGFNDAFFESDQENSESPQVSNSSTSKSKDSSDRAIVSTRRNRPRFLTQHKRKNVASNTERNNNSGHIKNPNKQFPSGNGQKYTKNSKKLSTSTRNCSGGSDMRPRPVASQQECDQPNTTPSHEQHHNNESETSNIIRDRKSTKWSEKLYTPRQAQSCPLLQNAISQNLLEKALDIPHKIYTTPPETKHSLTKHPDFIIYEYVDNQKIVSSEQAVVSQVCSKEYNMETNNCQNYYYDQQTSVRIQNYCQNNQIYAPNLTECKQWSDLDSARCNMLPNLANPKEIGHFEESELKNYFIWSNPPYEVWPQAEKSMPNAAYLPHGMTSLQTPQQPTFDHYANPVPPMETDEYWLNMYKSVDIPTGFDVDIPPGYGSEEEFMNGASLVPHSSELEINVQDEEEPLAPDPERLSTAQLAEGAGRHAAALRNLLDEAAARRSSPSLHPVGERVCSIALAERPGCEELPTRDPGLIVAAECLHCDNSSRAASHEFVAGSFMNNACPFGETGLGRGRGRGRLNAFNKDIIKLSRPFAEDDHDEVQSSGHRQLLIWKLCVSLGIWNIRHERQ